MYKFYIYVSIGKIVLYETIFVSNNIEDFVLYNRFSNIVFNCDEHLQISILNIKTPGANISIEKCSDSHKN